MNLLNDPPMTLVDREDPKTFGAFACLLATRGQPFGALNQDASQKRAGAFAPALTISSRVRREVPAGPIVRGRLHPHAGGRPRPGCAHRCGPASYDAGGRRNANRNGSLTRTDARKVPPMSYLPLHLFRPVVGDPRTVGELIDAYLTGCSGWHGAAAEYPANGNTSEASNMAYALTSFREATHRDTEHGPLVRIGDLLATEMRPAHLRSAMATMIRDGLSRTGINARKGRIVRWVRWLVSYERIPVAVLTALKTVGPVKATTPGVTTRPRVECIDAETVEATRGVACGALRRALHVHQLTGMRPGELVSMRVCDLSPHPDGETWDYKPAHHKTEHSISFARVIPLGPRSRAELNDQVAALQDQACGLFARLPRLGDADDTRRFWPWTTTNGYYQAVKRAAIRAGVAPWAPNRLRHNLLTEAINERDAKTAQSLGGHATDKTSQRSYFHGHAEAARAWAREHG